MPRNTKNSRKRPIIEESLGEFACKVAKVDEQEENQGPSLHSPPVLQSLVAAGNLLHYFSRDDLLSFALVNKGVHAACFDRICDTVMFYSKRNRVHTHYMVKNVFYSRTQINHLPATITHITFGHSFNNEVHNLPSGITHLAFTGKFNRHVDELPNGLAALSFAGDFNQPVDKLPLSLLHLSLEGEFNQPVNHLPYGLKSLKILNLKRQYKHSIEQLPPSLEDFSVIYGHRVTLNQCNSLISVLPPTLLFFHCSVPLLTNLDNFPTSLQYLEITDTFNVSVDHLPPSLRKLDIQYGSYYYEDSFVFNQPVNNLPQTLTWLSLGPRFNKPIDMLPPKLAYLDVGGHFNQPVDHLPTDLKRLVLGSEFNQPVDNLPPSLRELTVGLRFRNSIANLPASLKYLEIRSLCALCLNDLPVSLQVLYLHYFRDYVKSDPKKFPNSLTTIHISHKASSKGVVHFFYVKVKQAQPNVKVVIGVENRLHF